MSLKTKHEEGDLRVWYIHQCGSGEMFMRDVATIEEAKSILETIYDLANFLYESDELQDYCNGGGLEVYEPDDDGGFEWCEWCDEDGRTIDEVINDY